MKKQIIYPKPNMRILSTMLDFVLIMAIMTPAGRFVTYCLQQFYDINLSQYTPEQLVHAENIHKIQFFFFSNLLISICMLWVYFVFFWYKFGATPGKYILRMKIVDATDMKSRPSLGQCIKRIMIISVGGFLSIILANFSYKKQTIYDKASNVIVVTQ